MAETFFVKNGFVNGEDGINAVTCAGDTLRDGWYYLIGSEPDPNDGPFASKEAAEVAARAVTKEYGSITVKKLRDALNELGAGHDNTEVWVWLPGSEIFLGGPKGGVSAFLRDGKFMLEGNLAPGSALS